jgi:hypothetical protein
VADVLTTEIVVARVDAIRAVSGDPERAHAEEDRLWREVLEAIATDCFYGLSPRNLARLALKTTTIDFERWCA